VDYFARTQYIVFTVGTVEHREPAVLVRVQADRLQVILRLGPETPSGDRLLSHRDRAWEGFRHKMLLTSPSDVDDSLRFWIKKALIRPN
jgi:hypothetical protein